MELEDFTNSSSYNIYSPLQLSNLGLLHTADHQFAFVVTDTDQSSQDMDQLLSRGNYHTLSQT